MKPLDPAQTALDTARLAASLTDSAAAPPPTPQPTPEPTRADRARATACEYTGLGCDVVEDSAGQTASGAARRGDDPVWMSSQRGGTTLVGLYHDDGSSIEGPNGHARFADVEASLFHTQGPSGGPVNATVDLLTAHGQMGAHQDQTRTSLGFNASASLVELNTKFGNDELRGELGVTVGAGVAGEVAREDADNDGIPEVCIGGAAHIFSGRACMEVSEGMAPAVNKAFDIAYELSPSRLIYRFSN